jgi:hypothetical protein
MRAAIGRALAAKLNATELRVFLALVQLVTLYDRCSDTVANRQIVAATGLDPRHVRRALGVLDERGVIDRRPGKGRVASLITFREGAEPAPSEGARTDLSEGADDALSEGAPQNPERGRESDTRGGAYAPASEALSENSSERERVVPELVVFRDRRQLIASLVAMKVDEAVSRVTGLEVQHPFAPIDDILADLVDRGAGYTWPTELVGALKAQLTAFSVGSWIQKTDGPRQPAACTNERCRDGNVEEDDGTVSRCPICTVPRGFGADRRIHA